MSLSEKIETLTAKRTELIKAHRDTNEQLQQIAAAVSELNGAITVLTELKKEQDEELPSLNSEVCSL